MPMLALGDPKLCASLKLSGDGATPSTNSTPKRQETQFIMFVMSHYVNDNLLAPLMSMRNSRGATRMGVIVQSKHIKWHGWLMSPLKTEGC